jgi:hypothetical protein
MPWCDEHSIGYVISNLRNGFAGEILCDYIGRKGLGADFGQAAGHLRDTQRKDALLLSRRCEYAWIQRQEVSAVVG